MTLSCFTLCVVGVAFSRLGSFVSPVIVAYDSMILVQVSSFVELVKSLLSPIQKPCPCSASLCTHARCPAVCSEMSVVAGGPSHNPVGQW